MTAQTRARVNRRLATSRGLTRQPVSRAADFPASGPGRCIPDGMEEAEVADYDGFLKERRLLMAGNIRDYYRSL